MAAEQYVELRQFTTGARIAIITGATGSGSAARNGFLRVTTSRQLNAPGLLRLELPGDYPGLWAIPDKCLVIVWRRDNARAIDWYREFVGIYRDIAYASQGHQTTATLICPGLLSILSWYHILWPANVTNRTTFTAAKAETIIKTLATYNAVAASATTANGRDRAGRDYGVSVQTDAAGGATIDWTANRSKTLLETIQDIQRVSGGDIDLVYNSSTDRQLRFYSGQRGVDRTATVVFAEKLGNMDNVKFSRVRATERTAAVVGGTGQEAARTTTVRTGTNYSSTNDIETFVDAKDLGANDSAASRSARGDKRLDELEARDEFSFDVVQTEGIYYHGSYDLGDLVSAVRPDGVTVSQQVSQVDLDYTAAGEHITIGVRTP